MACLLALAVAATVLMAQPGQLASAARTSPAEAFWRAALPDAPMPDAIHELLHPETAVRNGVTTAEASEDGGSKPPMNFKCDDYKGASPRSESTNNAPSPDVLNRAGVRNGAAYGDDSASSSTVFFLEDAVRVGESLPFPSTQRDVAAASPARRGELALPQHPARRRRRRRRWRGVRRLPLRLYTVRSVSAVEGSSFVVCLSEGGGRGAAAVYGCRATADPARAYVLALALAGERGDDAVMSAAAVCHTDTSRWDPARAAFRLLGVKPGAAAAICHAVPNAQILSAN